MVDSIVSQNFFFKGSRMIKTCLIATNATKSHLGMFTELVNPLKPFNPVQPLNSSSVVQLSSPTYSSLVVLLSSLKLLFILS